MALTADLPSDLRDDVVGDVRANLEEARLHATSEAEVREVLERLGAPEAIAAEARAGIGGGNPPMPPPLGPPRRRGVRAVDVIVVALISLGGVLLAPLIGFFALLAWVVGIIMLWVSPTWTSGEKTFATLVWPGGLLLPAVFAFLPGRTCEGVEADGVLISETCSGFSLPLFVGVPLMILMVAAPIAVAIVLLRRAGARAR